MYHQKSDCLIVVMKLVKTSGVKGTAGRRFLEGKAAQHGRLVSVKQSGGFYSILPCEIMLPIKATKFFQLSQFTKCA